MAAANFFSDESLKLGNLPKIRNNLPRIQMRGESDLLFEIDGQNVGMDDVAESFTNLFFNL